MALQQLPNQQMRLIRFRVTDFRSVTDSGWIDTDTVTALIGTNESGKTNLLVPLWKLNPAMEGAINPIADFPRKRYNEIRSLDKKPVFITAQFELSSELETLIAARTAVTEEQVHIVEVMRDLGGSHYVTFPEAKASRDIEISQVVDLLSQGLREIEALAAGKTEETIKADMRTRLMAAHEALKGRAAEESSIDADGLREIESILAQVSTEGALRRSTIVPAFGAITDKIADLVDQISKPHPNSDAEAIKLVLSHLPSFVYYSNYGNLDSEIYLPHVIENMQRKDLGSREEAKVRTLRVLFEFVRLKPEEIRELGRDFDPQGGRPNEDQIKEIADRKTEREILLQSASTELTRKFRDWWKQGNYRFRLQADGDHFRIWVADEKRPEEIELEGRSSGLQWFLSFYLIFLVESQEAHKGAVLLLDEPGLSLHPIAQQDLSAFFEGLSSTNQLIYTTHSPFLVDANHLDRVRAVYVDSDGATVASANLRAGERSPSESHSVYPVHAALGLTVSETLLLGCQPVIVEGHSDQIYLSAIKTFLIAQGHLNPSRELLFMPGGGRKGITSLVAIVTGKEEKLPYVLLDSDTSGHKLAHDLRSTTYSSSPDRVLQVGDFCSIPEAEIEDLLPSRFLASVIAKYLRTTGLEEEFNEVVAEGKAIVPQVEAYAERYALELEQGWKVVVAKRAKERIVAGKSSINVDDPIIETWAKMFRTFETDVIDLATRKQVSA